MLKTERLVILLLIFFPQLATAGGEVSFGAQLGHSDVRIRNQDGTNAYYDGLAFQGQAGLGFINTYSTSLDLKFNINYLDLENRASTGEQREAGRHLGAGAELGLRIYRFAGGYNYRYMDAKHYWVGDSENTYKNFQYYKQGWYAGLDFNISRSTRLGLFYSQETAAIPKSEVGTDVDLKMHESSIFLRVTVLTTETLGDYFSYIFGTKRSGQ